MYQSNAARLAALASQIQSVTTQTNIMDLQLNIEQAAARRRRNINERRLGFLCSIRDSASALSRTLVDVKIQSATALLQLEGIKKLQLDFMVNESDEELKRQIFPPITFNCRIEPDAKPLKFGDGYIKQPQHFYEIAHDRNQFEFQLFSTPAFLHSKVNTFKIHGGINRMKMNFDTLLLQSQQTYQNVEFDGLICIVPSSKGQKTTISFNNCHFCNSCQFSEKKYISVVKSAFEKQLKLNIYHTFLFDEENFTKSIHVFPNCEVVFSNCSFSSSVKIECCNSIFFNKCLFTQNSSVIQLQKMKLFARKNLGIDSDLDVQYSPQLESGVKNNQAMPTSPQTVDQSRVSRGLGQPQPQNYTDIQEPIILPQKTETKQQQDYLKQFMSQKEQIENYVYDANIMAVSVIPHNAMVRFRGDSEFLFDDCEFISSDCAVVIAGNEICDNVDSRKLVREFILKERQEQFDKYKQMDKIHELYGLRNFELLQSQQIQDYLQALDIINGKTGEENELLHHFLQEYIQANQEQENEQLNRFIATELEFYDELNSHQYPIIQKKPEFWQVLRHTIFGNETLSSEEKCFQNCQFRQLGKGIVCCGTNIIRVYNCNFSHNKITAVEVYNSIIHIKRCCFLDSEQFQLYAVQSICFVENSKMLEHDLNFMQSIPKEELKQIPRKNKNAMLNTTSKRFSKYVYGLQSAIKFFKTTFVSQNLMQLINVESSELYLECCALIAKMLPLSAQDCHLTLSNNLMFSMTKQPAILQKCNAVIDRINSYVGQNSMFIYQTKVNEKQFKRDYLEVLSSEYIMMEDSPFYNILTIDERRLFKSFKSQNGNSFVHSQLKVQTELDIDELEEFQEMLQIEAIPDSGVQQFQMVMKKQ